MGMMSSQNSFGGMPLQNSFGENNAMSSYNYMPPPFSSENFAFSRHSKLQSSGPVAFHNPMNATPFSSEKPTVFASTSSGSVDAQSQPTVEKNIKAPPARCPSEGGPGMRARAELGQE